MAPWDHSVSVVLRGGTPNLSSEAEVPAVQVKNRQEGGELCSDVGGA